MKVHRIFLAAAVLLLIGAAAFAEDMGYGTQGMNRKSDPKMTPTLQALEQKVNDAFKNRDSAVFLSLVDPDGFSGDGMGFTPVAQIPDMMKDMEIRSYTMSDYKTTMIDKNAWLSTFVWKGDASYKGQAVPPVPMYCSTIWVRRGNDWKAIYHQESAAMPEMQQNAGHAEAH